MDNYAKKDPRRPGNLKYLTNTEDTLRRTSYWITTRKFFAGEVIPILEGKIKIQDTRSKSPLIYDVLFEYLVVKAVTIMELQLKYYCNLFVKKFPERAELLLKDRDSTKDLSLQILSTYRFSNLKDIHHVFSTLLEKDYFQVLIHRSEEHKSSIGYESDRPNRASPLFKTWKLFPLIIDLRNNLVHHNNRIRIKSKVLKKNLLTTIYDVNLLTSLEESELPYDEYSFSRIRPSY